MQGDVIQFLEKQQWSEIYPRTSRLVHKQQHKDALQVFRNARGLLTAMKGAVWRRLEPVRPRRGPFVAGRRPCAIARRGTRDSRGKCHAEGRMRVETSASLTGNGAGEPRALVAIPLDRLERLGTRLDNTHAPGGQRTIEGNSERLPGGYGVPWCRFLDHALGRFPKGDHPLGGPRKAQTVALVARLPAIGQFEPAGGLEPFHKRAGSSFSIEIQLRGPLHATRSGPRISFLERRRRIPLGIGTHEVIRTQEALTRQITRRKFRGGR